MIYAVLEGIPGRVLALEDDCHILKLPFCDDRASDCFIETGSATPTVIRTFKRTPSRMMSGERNCVVFCEEWGFR